MRNLPAMFDTRCRPTFCCQASLRARHHERLVNTREGVSRIARKVKLGVSKALGRGKCYIMSRYQKIKSDMSHLGSITIQTRD